MNIKNFGLEGVASSVQLGKGGATLQGSSDSISAMDPTGQTLVNVQAADPQAANDVVTLEYLQAQNGMDFQLGTPTDDGLADGAVPLTSSTTVTNAVDAINEILGKLVPTAPANFPGSQTLSISGTTTALLASGAVPDNTNGGTLPATAGNSVSRTTATSVSSNVIGDNGTTGFVGPGNSGVVSAVVNANTAASVTMNGTNQTVSPLVISNDTAYPAATPGFWYSFRAALSGASATQGWNRYSIQDSVAGNTNDAYIVCDNLTATPVISAGSVVQGTAGTFAYSSSVPHYGTGGVLTVGYTASNIAGETYSSGNILTVSGSNGILSSVGYAAGAGGLSNPIARQTTTFTASGLSIPVNGSNVFASGQISGAATNPNGTGTLAFGPTILVQTGSSASGKIYELNVPVTIAANGGPSSNATRITTADGDNPSVASVTTTSNTWTSSAAIQTWDATVVAGVLKNDVTNYSTGYLPVGPNLSGQEATQYATFMFQRTAMSKFNIAVTGTYSGMWVNMPGYTSEYTSTANGWYNMFVSYSGSGQPGDTNGANGSLGCALAGNATGSSGSFTCTFGTLSSTNSASNIVLVRIALTAGQSITALSFIPSTN